MKVGINISSLHQMSKGRGIGFYTQYLVDSLKEYTDAEIVIIDSPDSREKVDLIHFPFFDFFRHTLKITHDIPTVVTIHDVIPLLFPKHYPPGIKGRINLYRQKQALKKVKAVITDSVTSAKDAVRIFSLPQNDVVPIYLAPAKHFQQMPKTESRRRIEKFKLPENYLLYTGGVNWNKNLINQTQAGLKTGMDIVFAGSGFENRANLNHPELKEFKLFLSEFEKNPKIHILGFVTNEDLVGLINLASAVLFASRYEGFGLPILEAQSCGIPVITSRSSSMLEVAGDGAVLVDPDSEGDIESGVSSILKGSLKREQLIKRGFENAKKFSWKKTALETMKVYENALR